MGDDKHGTARLPQAPFSDATGPEQQVIRAVCEGRKLTFTVPEGETPEQQRLRTIRAALVRFLALGGDEARRAHESGVKITNAVLTGDLDFEGATLTRDVELEYCNIPGKIILQDATTRGFNLSFSTCGLIAADRVRVASSLFLRFTSIANDAVILGGARIDGDLVLDGCQFNGFGGESHARDIEGDKNLKPTDPGATSLSCTGTSIGQDLFLRDGVKASSTISFRGSTIRGNVICAGPPPQPLPEPKSEPEPITIDLAWTTIDGVLSLDRWPVSNCRIDLTDAKVGRLDDRILGDEQVPRKPVPGELCLDGLTYDRFSEETRLTEPARTAFLMRQRPVDLGAEFRPQPWEQVIAALRKVAQNDVASAVAINKQGRLRKAGKIAWGLQTLHWLYGVAYGYGYRPVWLMGWAAFITVVGAIFYHAAAGAGAMMPSDRKVAEDLRADLCKEQRFNLADCPALALRYTAFNPVIHSIELTIPVLGLQQTKDWAAQTTIPCEEKTFFGLCLKPATDWLPKAATPGYSPWGLATAFVIRLHALFGWVASFMFLAVVSGLVKKD